MKKQSKKRICAATLVEMLFILIALVVALYGIFHACHSCHVWWNVGIIGGVVLLLFMACLMHLISYWVRRGQVKKRICQRTPLSDEEFCKRGGFEFSPLHIVKGVRAAMARQCNISPESIYPDDLILDVALLRKENTLPLDIAVEDEFDCRLPFMPKVELTFFGVVVRQGDRYIGEWILHIAEAVRACIFNDRSLKIDLASGQITANENLSFGPQTRLSEFVEKAKVYLQEESVYPPYSSYTIKTVNGYLIVVIFQEDRIIDSSIAIICNVDVRKIEELLQGMGAKAGDYPWGVLGIDDGRVEGIPFIFIKYVKT